MQFDCAAHIIDVWVDKHTHGRSNVAPSKLPWNIIRSLVLICYNGKIDNGEDSRRLESLIDKIMVPEAFDEGFDVVKAATLEHDKSEGTQSNVAAHALLLPATANWTAFEKWIGRLPEREPPAYLGLPDNAEKLLLVEHGKEMLRNVSKVMRILDESEQVMADE